MIDSIKRMSLDLHSTTSNESVRVKRSDTGRKICISLVDGGLPYTISDGCYAYFTAKKPDGNILKNRCSIENNTVIYRLTEQTTSVVGRVDSEIKLYGADGRCITSSKFTICVYDTVYSTGDNTQPDKTDPILQSKSVTPSAKNQVVVPDTNYDGLAQVTVAGDADLVAGNIKKGVEIFGVTGSYEATGGTTLPTLTNPGTADDLAEDKQFIDANGNVVTGTVPTKDIVAQTNVDSVMFDSQSGKISVVGKLGEKAIVSGTASIFTNVPAGEFGDASASDVAKGKTFTSQNGLKVVGTHECGGGGVSLPTLTNPGTADDLASGKQLIDADGIVVTGNLYEYTENTTPFLGHQNAEVFANEPDGVPTLNIKGQTTGQGVVRKGAWAQARAPLSMLGDATAADVVAGKTFTSAAGLKVVGTMTPGSGGDFTVTDDGAGNVTITSSAITDNDGNVVIA